MSSHSGYGDKGYWDTRYGGGSIDTYEWYMPWATFKGEVLPFLHAVHAPAEPHKHVAPSLTLQQIRKSMGVKGESKAQADANAVILHAGTATNTAAAESAATSAAASSASAAASSSGASAAPSAPPVAPPPCPQCLQSRILNAGCGNSELSAHMWLDGFTQLVSVDYSGVVIDKMKSLYTASGLPDLAASFLEGDVRDLRPLPPCKSDGSFHAILDKGTLDAILCGADSNRNATAMLAEMHRLLDPEGGVLLIVTYGQPAARMPLLERRQFQWSVQYVPLGATRFMYACRRRRKANK